MGPRQVPAQPQGQGQARPQGPAASQTPGWSGAGPGFSNQMYGQGMGMYTNQNQPVLAGQYFPYAPMMMMPYQYAQYAQYGNYGQTDQQAMSQYASYMQQAQGQGTQQGMNSTVRS